MLSSLIEMGRAWFRADTSSNGNETMLDAKPNTNDPTKHRQGTYDRRNYFGAFSGDFLVGNSDQPTRLERVLIGLKPDDDPLARAALDTDHPGGAYEVSCQRPGTSDDPNMVNGLRVTSRFVELHGVKIVERTLGGTTVLIGGTGGASRDLLTSSDGRFTLIMQTDGNLVIYRNADGVPLWASNTNE